LAADQFDFVELEIFQDAAALHLDDFSFVVHEIVDGEVVFQRIVDAIEAALFEAGEIEGGFAKCFAGNRAGVDAAAADGFGAFHDRDSLTEIGGLSGSLFASGAAANYDQVEGVWGRHASLLDEALEVDCMGGFEGRQEFVELSCRERN
jgi:hypothetical protein